jgi:hypothetical protein
MSSDLSSAASESLDKARAALKTAFGSISPDRIALLDGGISGAYPYRVDVGNRSYLIRVEGAASPLRNPHQYESMWIASEAGIAPKVHFVDKDSRVAVMDSLMKNRFPNSPAGRLHWQRQSVSLWGVLEKPNPFRASLIIPKWLGAFGGGYAKRVSLLKGF